MNDPKKNIYHEHLGMSAEDLQRSLANRLEYSVGKDSLTANLRDWYNSLSYVMRDRMIERWMSTMRSYYHQDTKRVYYLSLEFLIGRTLYNSILNLCIEPETRDALLQCGLDLEEIREQEPDAALGNGGLGRLAACFLDSMATLGLPGYGYGIRYEYGMFTQRIENGYQVEHPDNWLRYGNPWEFSRPEVLYLVRFYGKVVDYVNEVGKLRHHWVEGEVVMGMAYDTPIPGYGSNTVNNLRLWSAKSSREFNLNYFNEGNYIKAVADKNESENLSRVLYPNDTTAMGRELRLKQQYFFVSASLQDILYRYLKRHEDFAPFPDKVAIQLNDTHPAIAIPELMRLFMDVHDLGWDEAWNISKRTFSYTNHTIMSEALETWPVELIGQLLPRHLQIIYEINRRFLEDVRHRNPGDLDLLRRVSLIDERDERRLRMAHLAIVGSHTVNGVAKLHTEIIQQTIFADFHRLQPEQIVNVTNGVTQRRWMNQANPSLSALIGKHIGHGWLKDLRELQGLEPLAEDAGFRAAFRQVKQQNKTRLAALIHRHLQIAVNPESLFDVQVKRIHEYKRQLLNLLHVVHLYDRMRTDPDADWVPRTVILSGKAAPGYDMAKRIIKLIHDVADVINNDPHIGDQLRLVFIPDYDVSTAADIIPAAELSQQISMAGTEASGTGNMKLSLNGALTIGTLDGANVEIREAVGEENMFIFGLDCRQAVQVHAEGYDPRAWVQASPALSNALKQISEGFFSPEELDRHRPIVEDLLRTDRYLLCADFEHYLQTQEQVLELYRQPEEWTRRAILNVARMGCFSSDRAIHEYAKRIWAVSPVVQGASGPSNSDKPGCAR
ncbi:glycogen/starch/alpha-glucan phosphorylase [Sedimenticola hydrogenitrophicus]|uniref:glycogen/starch/alpha-glucan phosphorylase n=1 Tax=Sedimenticola hydrogenitrophicus TaxID=2967975 RepID=UPI0023B165A0|nr:glycogen/starch/alpha-glucan phosphorylase [Sedimenticola hydrogenitrophicus]